MINFACSGCGKTFSVKDEFAGRKTKCSKCGVSLRVPAGTRSRTSSSAPAPPSPSAVVQPAYVGVDSPEALPITSLDENRPAKGKKRLLIGLSVGSGVMLIALIVLAIVLTSGGNSKSGSGPPSETEKQGLTRYQVWAQTTRAIFLPHSSQITRDFCDPSGTSNGPSRHRGRYARMARPTPS